MGLITPLGIGKEMNWDAVSAGRGGIGPITRFDASPYTTRIAGELPDFDPLLFIDRKECRKMDRFIQYAVAAAELAVQDAGIDREKLRGDRTGVHVGSGIGGIAGIEETHKVLLDKGPGRVSPFFLISSIINEAAGQISIRFGAGGPNLAVATACTTSTHAVGDSFRIIARGDAERMLAGGSEAPISPLGLAGFCSMRALSTRNDDPARASRPFDRERDGFIMGEGAGILLLEELDTAIGRGARIYAELVGYGMSGDAYHVSAPQSDGDGAARSMLRAIRDAGVRPQDVDYINAHGTSTPWNDKIETLAIKRVFGDHAHRLAVSSTKSMTGHLLGAAGGVETAFSALSLHHQLIPPTINLEYPDPECDLDYVPQHSRPGVLDTVLSNSFGFGGTNGTLILKKYVP
jgi:3-oxoacyl-[acyl-carrier-protein] synthase II